MVQEIQVEGGSKTLPICWEGGGSGISQSWGQFCDVFLFMAVGLK